MINFSRAVARALLLASIAICAAVATHAQQTAEYDLRSAEFSVPADWAITYSARDQEYDFASPDGRYQLWARWWFPDEPLLGFDDIVRHEKRTMAGQETLFIHSDSGGQRVLQLAFMQKDAEGEIFLWQFIANGVPQAEHEAMFDQLLSGLVLNGQPALAPTQGSAATPDTPATPAPAPTANTGTDMYRDAEGAFTLPLPPNWTVQTTGSTDLRQALLTSPGGDALLLAVVPHPDRAAAAAPALDTYLGVLYRDSLIVKSIEGETYPDIAGGTVHALDTIAKVFSINGVAMPYPRGRVQIYRSDAPFLIVTVRPQDAAPELAETLSRIALGLQLGAGTPTPQASTHQAAPPAAAQPAASATPGLLFDGQSLDGLVPFAFSGGDFDTQARLTGDAIEFAFPKDLGWAKLGLATRAETVEMPNRESPAVQRITALIDPAKSTGLFFGLAPADAPEKDPHEVADIRLQFFNLGDGRGRALLMVRGARRDLDARFAWPTGHDALHVLLRPDQVLELRDGQGSQLAEFPLPFDFGGTRWALQTYLKVNRKHAAGRLVLKRLSVDTLPHYSVPDPDTLADDTRPTVLFDGFALGRIWASVSGSEGHYDRFARLADGAFRVGWSAEDKGSSTGIATPEAAVWLDRFRGVAEARIELALDGAASKDFEISLTPRYTLPGNLTGRGAYVLRFRQDEDGTFRALSARRGSEDAGLETAGLPALPDRLALVVTPGGVRVDGDALPDGVVPFPDAIDGTGLRIALRAMPTAAGDGALVLRGVRLIRRAGPYPTPPQPAPGVAPLPQTVVFDTRPDASWTQLSQGKADFAALSRQGPDGLALSRRDPPPDGNRIALVGTATAADLDYPVETTPYQLTVQLAATPGLGFRLYLHGNPDRFADKAKAVVTLREIPAGPDAGKLELQLHSGHFHYDRWRRVLPASYLHSWDGTLRLRLGADWIAVALGNDWLMRGPHNSRKLMLALTPGGIGREDGGAVTLRRITGGWVTPDGMTGTERMRLDTVTDFDAGAFLDLLANEPAGASE